MKHILVILLTLFITACQNSVDPANAAGIDISQIESETTSLDSIQQSNMNGVFVVLKGKELYGDLVVGKWVDGRWCMYSEHDVVLSEVGGGWSGGNAMLFSGFTQVVRSGRSYRMDLRVDNTEGGNDLASKSPLTRFVLRGNSNNIELEFQRLRPAYLPIAPYQIIAHRGGGRNSERLGVSENSVSMIRRAQKLGATAVEIDVKRTRDGKLIVFHDDTFSPRTVVGTFLLGKVEEFDLAQIQAYGRLVNGEAIPSLDEMLTAIIDSTDLQIVWLDVKDAWSVDAVLKSQHSANDHAKQIGRTVNIALGIPSVEVLNAYRTASLANTMSVICELDLTIVNSLPTCIAWAPRWTLGITSAQIAECHASNRLVFTWTLDVRDYIAEFLYGKDLDGILTNYPSLVAGMQGVR